MRSDSVVYVNAKHEKLRIVWMMKSSSQDREWPGVSSCFFRQFADSKIRRFESMPGHSVNDPAGLGVDAAIARIRKHL